MLRRRKKKNNFLFILISLLIIVLAIGAYFIFGKEDKNVPIVENNEQNNEQNNVTNNSEKKTISKMTFIAAGDSMFHDDQLDSAYDKENGSYDFNSFFEYVTPYFTEADLAVANFETTLGGDTINYTGYPIFNSPDSVIDAVKNAGIDLVTTSNNHSFDTGLNGLKRTAQQLKKHDLDFIGTYEEKPDSRIKMKEINEIKVGLLAYTEMINKQDQLGLSDDEIQDAINLMDKDRIVKDTAEAKENGADIIIAFMHWGVEYSQEPSAAQKEYAQFMAEQGVDIIIGSHPHVIQKSDRLETNDTFIVYSLGNFISNQRRETLGDEFKRTEDGAMVKIELEKNLETDDTYIRDIDYIPTWVSKNETEVDGKYDYRIIPIKQFLEEEASFEDTKDIDENRLKESLEATEKYLNTYIK